MAGEHDHNSTGEGCHHTVSLKVATPVLFAFRNQPQSFIILLHFINLYLCSAWAVVRIQFYKVILRVQRGISFPRANFAKRTL